MGTTVTNVTSKANAPSKTKANNTASSKSSSSSSYSSILNATGNASNAPSDVPPRPAPTSKNSSASKDDTDYDALLGIPSIQDEAKAVFLEKTVDALAQSQGSQATSSSMNAQVTSRASQWNLNAAVNSSNSLTDNTGKDLLAIGLSIEFQTAEAIFKGSMDIHNSYEAFKNGQWNQSFNDLKSIGTDAVSVLALKRLGMFGANLKTVAKIESTVNRNLNTRNKLEQGFHELNPKDVRFSQSTASPYFSSGERVDNLAAELKNGTISPYDLPPIRVVSYDGKLFSIDNRRLLAFNVADIEKVPVEIVSLENSDIAEIFDERFNPIGGEGNLIAVATRNQRAMTEELLSQNNLIEENQFGY